MSLDSTIVSTVQEFSFSIDHPPPTDFLDKQLLTMPYSFSPQGVSDTRLRGNSVSSTSTMTAVSSVRSTQDGKDPSCDAPPDQHLSFSLWWSHIPAYINIRSISSHAQAEALDQSMH